MVEEVSGACIVNGCFGQEREDAQNYCLEPPFGDGKIEVS